MSETDDHKFLLGHLGAESSTGDGVAAVKMSDGTMFMFTLEALERLIEKARTNEHQRVLVFVKTGRILTKERMV